MEYQFSNYFANPEDLNALAHHLLEGSVLVLQEDSSLTVESFDQSGIEFSGGSYTSNYPIDNVGVIRSDDYKSWNQYVIIYIVGSVLLILFVVGIADYRFDGHL